MIYLAGPLFTQAEQAWLRGMKTELTQHGHEVCWPFELFKDGQIADWGPIAPRRIMERCREALDRASLVVAWLDGAQVDDGTAWEIGYAYAKGKLVHGIRTDFRQAGDTSHSIVNAMVEASCASISRSVAELVRILKR
ncbi:MAG: nucleoside 2-deoxyribosyltransferase [Humidesulfovibrio sp.]|nr:nucleoside 2-deoxyribosyltransferase [Humidesulfovibrio sp.]